LGLLHAFFARVDVQAVQKHALILVLYLG
jgi:hypothetical protein